MTRLGIFQSNPRIGDFSHNLALLKRAFSVAAEKNVGIVVSSELATTGCYPQDLLMRRAFIDACEQLEADILEYSTQYPAIALVYGTPERFSGNCGSVTLFNALRVIQNGARLGTFRKTSLPTTGLSNERRHFKESANDPLVLEVNGANLAFGFCDVANVGSSGLPLLDIAESKADVLVTLNASTAGHCQPELRKQAVAEVAKGICMPVVYVNQVSAEEHAVYDGGSFAVNKAGVVTQQLDFFKEDFQVVEMKGQDTVPAVTAESQQYVPSTQKYIIDALCFGLQQYMRQSSMSKVLVGCSGGLDSALTIALAARALGPENVVAVTMPSKYSSEGSVTDSELLCSRLGVELKNIPIEGMVNEFSEKLASSFVAPSGVARENLQARTRGTLLMTLANQYGYLLLTTGNKSEGAVGYFTLYGDSCGGLNLIGDLYKTEVYEVSHALNEISGHPVIPAEILTKQPSAELAPGQRDDDSLPPYPVLDYYLAHIVDVQECTPEERVMHVSKLLQRAFTSVEDKAMLERVQKLVLRSEFKRHQVAPTLRLKHQAFGAGRQIPMTSAWAG